MPTIVRIILPVIIMITVSARMRKAVIMKIARILITIPATRITR